jgi:hypothetical protein
MESCQGFMVPYTFKKVFQSLDVSLRMKNISHFQEWGIGIRATTIRENNKLLQMHL